MVHNVLVETLYIKTTLTLMYLLNIFCNKKPSLEAGIRKNAICYNTWNEISTFEIQPYHCTVTILSAILEFVIGFVSNFYNWCPVSLRTIQWKNEVSILINDWVIANCSVSRPPFCLTSWNLLSYLSQTSTTNMRCHYAQFSEKKWSLYINKWLSYSQL